MKKYFGATALLLLSNAACATQAFQPDGPNLTYGAVSNAQTIASDVQNPAAAAVALEEGNRFRMGVVSSVGMGVEVGQVDNLIDEIDSLSTALDQQYNSVSDAQAVIDRFDKLLVSMGREGYVKVNAAAHAPLFPLVLAHSALGGSLVFDANAAVQARLGVMDDPLRYNPLSKQLETKTALYLKRALIGEISLAYSRRLHAARLANLYGGFRVRYMKGDLDKTLVSVKGNNDSQSVLTDFMKRTTEFNDRAVGLDVGTLWVSRHYRLGATLANLNRPTLDYRTVGTNCGADPSCNLAASFGDKIALSEQYVMDPQLQLEGALYSTDRNWVLAASADGNAIHDPVAGEVQWAAASVAYATDDWLMPGYRFGYRANLAGTKMTYLTTGFTLFKSFNFDVAYGLKRVVMNNESYPRSVMVNLGLELTF